MAGHVRFNQLLDTVEGRDDQIIRNLVYNTSKFYAPEKLGPEGEPQPKPLKKLRIATIPTRLKVFSTDRDNLEYDLEAFKPERDLARAQEIADKSDNVEMPEFLANLNISVFDNLQLTVFKYGFDFAAYRKELIDYIMRALKEKADVICFAELAYPYPSYQVDQYPDFWAFENELQEISDKYQVVIIGGSYHCLRTQTNECAIFLPVDYKRYKDIPDGVPSERTSPRTYTKRVPAKKAGEVVRRPPNIKFPYYTGKFGKFAVLICFDSFDPTLFLRFLAWNYGKLSEPQGRVRDDIDVIFVPSYSTNKHGWKVAKDLSYVTRSIVVYVDGPEDALRYGVAVCGLAIQHLDDHTGMVAEPTDKNDFAVFEINYKAFKTEQRTLNDRQTTSHFWKNLAGELPQRYEGGRKNSTDVNIREPEI